MASETDHHSDGRVAMLVAENTALREQLAATQHRVRNALAVLRSIARRSAETSESVDEYAMHLDGRIGAIARLQGALLLDPNEGMALDTLVADTLLTVVVREGDSLTLDGPKVRLKAKAAELLGLGLHELATNAVKFGALFWPHGRISVTWRVLDGAEPHLLLTWAETGAPSALSSSRSGFGREVLERTLPYELGAESTLDFTSEGVLWRIIVPLAAACLPSPSDPVSEGSKEARRDRPPGSW